MRRRTGTAVGQGASSAIARARPQATAPTTTKPPAQFYDPGLDAQAGQAQRGFDDLQADYGYGENGSPTGRLAGRLQNDYFLQQAAIGQSHERSLSDILRGSARAGQDFGQQRADVQRSFGYSMADLLTGRKRAGEDYGTAITGLERNYTRLGDSQTQNAQAAGVSGGGALAAALAARTENKAIDRQPIDTGYQRFSEDSATQEQRLAAALQSALAGIGTSEARYGEDAGIAQTRLGEDRDVASGGAALQYGRGVEDFGVMLSRGQRELAAFLQSIGAARWAQAAQAGYRP